MTYADKLIIDCGTNEEQRVPMSAEEIERRDADYAAAILSNYRITPSEIVIVADGIEEAIFEVTADPAADSVEVLVAGQSGVVPLLQGKGKLRVTSDVPGLIEVTGKAGALANVKSKVYAGVRL